VGRRPYCNNREKGAEKVDEFVQLTTTEGIGTGGLKAVSLDGHEMLVAHAGGEYFIADGRCPHMGGHLPDGTLEGTILTCPRHHSQFDLTDGHVVRWTDWEGTTLSIAKLLRHPRPLRTYAVKIEGDNILVGPEKAPPTQT
jgi:3-phenylpropionate/trans-cinnamate dioxygenase ferredoxin component